MRSLEDIQGDMKKELEVIMSETATEREREVVANFLFFLQDQQSLLDGQHPIRAAHCRDGEVSRISRGAEEDKKTKGGRTLQPFLHYYNS
jgi:hypothetical protein